VLGRDKSVGVATRYGQDGLGIDSRYRQDFPKGSVTHPPSSTAFKVWMSTKYVQNLNSYHTENTILLHYKH
jgi:hypothetical protein